jgi:RNase P subunit RPR2
MRHLHCARCCSVLVEDFWTMVEAETVHMFSSFTLTCRCGAVTRVDPELRQGHRRRSNVVPLAFSGFAT